MLNQLLVMKLRPPHASISLNGWKGESDESPPWLCTLPNPSADSIRVVSVKVPWNCSTTPKYFDNLRSRVELVNCRSIRMLISQGSQALQPGTDAETSSILIRERLHCSYVPRYGLFHKFRLAPKYMQSTVQPQQTQCYKNTALIYT
ncbi:hypothetical protein P153DRAFT_155657 [Dothidotthia symphoricarpi CBS 119687]|uniref:Uncharacterized protein n=1 Tax=Dothidotthia symphoricarpi CBS 119687 TaxID=1392245 RepID=A0A6A6AQC9_9PLEO|nr:uncharacterized protein P153DRAFT_155657 [Dothidotthia symphoricarpi CBS 119687]KAF2133368.1 hypothetical protein P153DRAFT_155657 [Dothidotthia symphoricarpi CBS 119687]